MLPFHLFRVGLLVRGFVLVHHKGQEAVLQQIRLASTGGYSTCARWFGLPGAGCKGYWGFRLFAHPIVVVVTPSRTSSNEPEKDR
jgi:hypothetical protein